MSLYQSPSADFLSQSSAEISTHAFASSLLRESGNRERAMHTNGNTGRRVSGDRRLTSSRHVSTKDFTDWVREQAQNYTEKELADLIGSSVKAAQNIRLGKSGCIGTTLANWCRNDKMFAAAYAEYVGLVHPGQADFVGRMNQAIAASQRLHMGGDAE